MFAAIWMIALPVSLVSPYSGILLWVWTALLSPNELLFGIMAGVPYNKVVAATTLSLMAFSKDRKDFYLDPVLIILGLFTLVATASYASALVQDSDTLELYLKLIKCVVLAFAISAVMTTRHRLHMLALAFVIALSFLGVKEGILWIITVGNHAVIGTGSIGDNNSVAAALAMTMPFMIYLARYSAVRLTRVALWSVTALCVLTTVATFSRGGFVGLAIIAGLLVRHSQKKLLSAVVVIFMAALIYFLAPESWFSRLSTIKEAGSDSSFVGRVVAWKVSLLIALDHPILGGGPHAVQRFVTWLRYVPQISSVNFMDTSAAGSLNYAVAAHSIYFEVLGDTGFLGLGLFLLLMATAYLQCRRVIRLCRTRPELAWGADLARMAQISIVVYLVSGAALSMAYFELVYILLALISRLHRTVRQEVTRTSSALPFSAAAAARRSDGLLGPGTVASAFRRQGSLGP